MRLAEIISLSSRLSRIFLATSLAIFQGVKIWIRDPELVWRKATLTEDFSQNRLCCVDEENEVRVCH